MGDRYVKSDKNKKILKQMLIIYMVTRCLNHYFNMKNLKFDEILNTPDVSDIGYFIEVDLSYPNNIKEKRRHFPFAPENEVIPKDKYNDYMKKIQPKVYTKS